MGGLAGPAFSAASAHADMTILRVEGVSFRYPGAAEDTLDEVTLSIEPGVCIAIVGPNGSGKSTLLRHLNGLLRPCAGRVTVDGVDARRLSAARLARRVGMVFQDPDAQLFASSVADEVRFGARNVGQRGLELEMVVAEALEAVGLGGLEHTNPYDLGRSQRKLLALASVLAMGTDVVALDEPITGQDLPGVQRVRSLIESLTWEGRAVALVSHDMDVVAEVCQRVVVLSRGRIVLDASPDLAFAETNWQALRQAGLEPPAAAAVGAELGLGSTPTERALRAALSQSRRTD